LDVSIASYSLKDKIEGHSRISADVIGTVARWVFSILMKSSGSNQYYLTERR
jgi:hypothetical protein